MAKRKAVSIKDVARESNASLTTVSLVLNNRDGRISRATRERVLDAVERLGYRPSRLAQSLQSQRSGFLGILVPQLRHAFADVYFGELISAIQETAGENDYKIILDVANPRYLERSHHLELFRRHYVDGLLCLGVTNNDTYLADFSEDQPVIVVNNRVSGVDLDFVQCDYSEAGRIAAKHLCELGHKKIGYIHGATEVQTTADLRDGFEEVLDQLKLPLPESRAEDGLYTEEGGAKAAIALLTREPTITAIFAGNDKMAIGAISGLKRIGMRVPDDVSVIGCDDVHQAEYCDPPLTTIHTPIYEVGARACGLLLDLISSKAQVVRETQPVSLTVRKSTAASGKGRNGAVK
ncbi:MAG TPA: LacI family DNA-binding transcriptional regulator [Phycisphaerae bacterium]|nr:LacI family DNA-binding transcriptional regulator [Phycisphaerae bacterium]HRW53410.1 LacI family DNA-binding transcriptional regulator [Phycisphaerae bacterium]